MKKRILLSIMSFFVVTSMWATLKSMYQVEVTASANGKTGETATLTLNLKNKNAIMSWQCLVTLPEGVTYKEGTFAIVDGRYPEGFDANVVATVNGDGTVTFLCESKAGLTLTGTAGAVATFDVEVASTVEPGDYPVIVNSSKMTEPNEAIWDWITPNEYVWTIEEGATVIQGDLNNDGVVNFTDATSILTVMGTGEYNASADVNNDGVVNFTDYMSILTIMGNQ